MGVVFKRLLDGNGTLYGEKPSVIARSIEKKLAELQLQGWQIISIAAVPDFHNFSEDGGVKDILFVCVKAEVPGMQWAVARVMDDDRSTLHGCQMNEILSKLQSITQALESAGCRVKHLVILTDHHSFAFGNGVGGYDGVKNILICYQIQPENL